MATVKVDVAPSVMVWARESMGLSLEEAARRARMDALALRFLEEGVSDPTFAQVERMAEAYHRPLIAFFLPEPLEDDDRMTDFRLLPENRSRSWSPEMHQAFRRVKAQQDAAVVIAEWTGDGRPTLQMSLGLRDDPEQAGAEIRNWLKAPTPDLLAGLTPGQVLRAWSDAIERQPILVTQVENVPLDEMRGFSLIDGRFPIIALNSKDTLLGRVFTLAHEFAHVLLRAGGMCDLEERRTTPRSHKERLERFCNEVAAAVLMPGNELLADPMVDQTSGPREWSDRELQALADRFGVSAEAMLLRLVTLGRASTDFYFRRRRHFLALYAARRRRQERTKSSGGLTYYERKLRNYGRRFARTVIAAYEQDAINGADLAHYLDLKLSNLHKLEEELGKG